MALLSTCADAALVVTVRRAAIEETAGARERRGTALPTLIARENMAAMFCFMEYLFATKRRKKKETEKAGEERCRRTETRGERGEKLPFHLQDSPKIVAQLLLGWGVLGAHPFVASFVGLL